eukprot:CAMPEP_0194504542 /NCGR_PEP_ID=MMETSP0253-20130528/29006_1 /TAXON_ID=2966 /ORGANISM="Noctiluca scintillans" /LENGTH=303 /DNA_ID=CAMNT_0039346951 /DNA_START=77 /DNA_END=988 /DNA_ORIENTATION=+
MVAAEAALGMALDDVIETERKGDGYKGSAKASKGDGYSKPIGSAPQEKLAETPSEALDLSLDEIITLGRKGDTTEKKGWSKEESWGRAASGGGGNNARWTGAVGGAAGGSSWAPKESWNGDKKSDSWSSKPKENWDSSWKSGGGGGAAKESWDKNAQKSWPDQGSGGGGGGGGNTWASSGTTSKWSSADRNSGGNGGSWSDRGSARGGWRGDDARERGEKRRDEEPKSRSSAKRVKVTNIPRDLHQSDIGEAFEAEAGKVVSCELDRGTCWITFSRPEDARKAVETFDRGELNGKTIGVTLEH